MPADVYPHLPGNDNLTAIHLEEVDRDFPGWCEGHDFRRSFVPAKVIAPNIVLRMK
jgi:hypothetical protein